MKEYGKSKVILADRDGFYLQRLKRCLERKGEMQVLAMTDSGQKLLELAKELHDSGLCLEEYLGAWQPEAESTVPETEPTVPEEPTGTE